MVLANDLIIPFMAQVAKLEANRSAMQKQHSQLEDDKLEAVPPCGKLCPPRTLQ